MASSVWAGRHSGAPQAADVGRKLGGQWLIGGNLTSSVPTWPTLRKNPGPLLRTRGFAVELLVDLISGDFRSVEDLPVVEIVQIYGVFDLAFVFHAAGIEDLFAG